MPDGPPHLVLVGMMGTGKTTVGRDLADVLGRPFVDLDAEVEAEDGRPVAAIFAGDGEAHFRRLERQALARVLGEPDPSVVATGGGVVLDAGNRAALGSHLVVWLRARPETLAARLGDGAGRPLLAGGAGAEDLRERVRAIADERAARYAEVADHVVDVDGLDPAEAADAVRAVVAMGSVRSRPAPVRSVDPPTEPTAPGVPR